MGAAGGGVGCFGFESTTGAFLAGAVSFFGGAAGFFYAGGYGAPVLGFAPGLTIDLPYPGLVLVGDLVFFAGGGVTFLPLASTIVLPPFLGSLFGSLFAQQLLPIYILNYL